MGHAASARTAHKSEGIGGNRGFRPDENDQGVIGEVFSDPNAETYAARAAVLRTRLRGQVVRDLSAAVRPARRHRGPVPGRAAFLARGDRARRANRALDFVPALPRGLTRFTYAFTLDTRLEKQIALGGRRASLVLEVFNLLNTNNEVEEDEVTGPAFRAATAVQPPRSVRLGFRLVF